MGMIQNEFEKIAKKALARYAKKYVVKDTAVQLVMFLKDEVVAFKTLVNYKPDEYVTILDLLNVRIDFLGKRDMVEIFITKVLHNLSEEHQVKPDAINVMVLLENDNVVMHLYSGIDHIKVLDSHEILNDQKLA